jgi:hypothetical protein
LERGAEINARDRDGLTPLHLSVANGNVKVRFQHHFWVSFFFRPIELTTTLFDASQVASVLLRNGANTNISDRFGRLPIDVSVDKTITLLPARSPADATFQSSPDFKTSRGSPLSQSGFVSRSSWSPPFAPMSGARLRTGHTQYDDGEPAELDQYDDGGPEGEYEEAPPFSPARLSDSEDSSSSGSANGFQQTGSYQPDDGQPKSKIKENAKKVWLKAKQVAKWQILSIAVRILLCYLLELFVENLKRVLHFIVIVRSAFFFLFFFLPSADSAFYS